MARARAETGIAVIMTALCLLPLMAFAAFGVDLASFYSRAAFLQKAADAASLAGTVWMPDIDQATTVACASLLTNGIDGGECGAGDFGVTIDRGSTATALFVTITDPSAPRYFSSVFEGGDQSLTRSAEAEYNLPLPLGSPLNYFGGDATKTVPSAPPTTYSVSWPADHTTRQPISVVSADTGCNIGTASSQGLGRWSGGGSFQPTNFNTDQGQCQWTVIGSPTGGANVPVPPPDYTTRAPTNPTCRIRSNGVADGTVIGRWGGSPPSYSSSTSNSGSPPMCTWQPYATDTASIPTFAGTVSPSPRPCRVGYETTGPGGASWTSLAYQLTSTAGGSDTNGNRLCRWTARITATTPPTPPNPIAATRSPGFWAQIHGPGGDQESGDAFSTRCLTAFNSSCGTPDNDLYVESSDPDQGYWYVVRIPEGGGGLTVIRVFDASLNPGDLDVGTGDSAITGSNVNFATTYRVYQQGNPLDFTSRTAVSSGAANATPNSCNWDLEQEAGFRMRWVDLCTLNTQPGELYLVNVRTATVGGSSNSAGRNGYALEACLTSSCTTGVQPAVHAFDKMVLYNNIDSGDSTFYIAEVAPQYAGKTLVLDLFDLGESSGTAWLYPRKPSTTESGPVGNVPVDDCTVDSTREGYPRNSDLNNGGVCSIRTASGGALYNGHWVTLRIAIPPDYSCTPGLNPETTIGSCWWGMRYSFSGSGSPTDTTTWQARIEGNPVHLTQ